MIDCRKCPYMGSKLGCAECRLRQLEEAETLIERVQTEAATSSIDIVRLKTAMRESIRQYPSGYQHTMGILAHALGEDLDAITDKEKK